MSRWSRAADRSAEHGRARCCALLVLALILIAGCSGPKPKAPVRDEGLPIRHPESAERVVMPGDTLFGIAWESGVDHRELAEWNKIPPPYIIKPGQRLRVVPPDSGKAIAQSQRKPPTTTRSQRSAARKSSTSRAPQKAERMPAYGPWIWPASGKAARNDTQKGVDILGVRGQRIVAAAKGRVVYRGSGLRGYGQLIILKHNDDYLSAYAHNDKIYVREGDTVKAGEHIADMGSTGADRVQLHFQIRYRGTPVDPFLFLPKK